MLCSPSRWILVGILATCASAWATTDPVAQSTLPSVETVLHEWAVAMQVDRPRELQFQRFEYDEVFRREERGTGSFALDSVGRARMLLAPAEIAEDARRNLRKGESYDVEPSTSERWYWGETDVYMLSPDEMTGGHGRRDVDWGWLWFLKDPPPICQLMLGLSEDELLATFDWEIDQNWKRSDTELHLISKPRKIPSNPNFAGQLTAAVLARQKQFPRLIRRVDVLLDRVDYRTLALRFTDTSGSKETVYVIDRITDINGDFWRPDLTGYEIRPSPPASDTVGESTEKSKLD